VQLEIQEVADMAIDMNAQGRIIAALSPNGKDFEQYEHRVSMQ
jgi:hypothetical protein